MKILTERAVNSEKERLMGDTWLFYQRLRHFSDDNYRQMLNPKVDYDKIKRMHAKSIFEILNTIREYDKKSYEILIRYNREELDEIIEFYWNSKEGA